MNLSGRLINRPLISTTIVDRLSAIDAAVEQIKKPTHTHIYNSYDVTPVKSH